MGERKKLTMYYPPDFDPRLVPRMKRDPNFVCEVRMMLPFSVQCNTCGEFMYMGKKFNSKKENANEKYKGIQIIRFYIKCSTCGAEMTFKTDPENGDYVMESGGSRTFEMWKEKQALEEENLQARIEEDKKDAMKALENKTLDSKMEEDIMNALDELKAVNQRMERIDTNAVLRVAAARREQGAAVELDDDEEAQVASAFAAKRSLAVPGEEEDTEQILSLLGRDTVPHDGKKKKKKKKKLKERGKGEPTDGADVGVEASVGMKPSPAALAVAAAAEDAAADPSSAAGTAGTSEGSAGVEAGNKDSPFGDAGIADGSRTASDLLLAGLQRDLGTGKQQGVAAELMPVIKSKKRRVPDGGAVAKGTEKKAKGQPVPGATAATTVVAPAPPKPQPEATGLLGLASYGSSSDDGD